MWLPSLVLRACSLRQGVCLAAVILHDLPRYFIIYFSWVSSPITVVAAMFVNNFESYIFH